MSERATDVREALGYNVEPTVVGPYETMGPSPQAAGVLDTGLVAHTQDGRTVVIGEVWAAAVGSGGAKIRIDSRGVAAAMSQKLNLHDEMVGALRRFARLAETFDADLTDDEPFRLAPYNGSTEGADVLLGDIRGAARLLAQLDG